MEPEGKWAQAGTRILYVALIAGAVFLLFAAVAYL